MNEIILYGADWCKDCKRAKAFLKENNIAYTYINIELDKAHTHTVEAINNGKRIIPTILINGKIFTNPPNDELTVTFGINEQGRVILYGADWCPDCKRSKTYLKENKINYQYINIDKHQWAVPIITKINNGKRKIPTILINENVYIEPSNEELRVALQLDKEKSEKAYDSIIIGGGAAGLTVSIYAQRDRFDTLILEKSTIGGNAFITEKIENYPGFTSISGPALMQKMEEQAKLYGATIKTGEEVVAIKKEGDLFRVKTKSQEYSGKTVVLATGATYKRLDIPGEIELIGSAIHFCATCDAAFYKELEVIVIGGGNSALEEGIYLSGIVKKVTIVHRNDSFKASQTYIEKLSEIKNIETFSNKESIEFKIDKSGKFDGLQVKDKITGQEEILKAAGVFIFVGYAPNNEHFKDLVVLDEHGFVKTTGLAETSLKGVFAAGDNRQGALAQVAAATGEGVLASFGIREYLKN